MTDNTRAPGTQEPPKRGRSKEDPTNADTGGAADPIQEAMRLLQPLIDFHEPVAGATDGDLRVYWDVRIVRGRDSPFAHATGSTSLPAVLAPNRIAGAPAAIQLEIQEKISEPLMVKLQAEIERLTKEQIEARDGEPDPEAAAAGIPAGETLQ